MGREKYEFSDLWWEHAPIADLFGCECMTVEYLTSGDRDSDTRNTFALKVCIWNESHRIKEMDRPFLNSSQTPSFNIQISKLRVPMKHRKLDTKIVHYISANGPSKISTLAMFKLDVTELLKVLQNEMSEQSVKSPSEGTEMCRRRLVKGSHIVNIRFLSLFLHDFPFQARWTHCSSSRSSRRQCFQLLSLFLHDIHFLGTVKNVWHREWV